MSSAAHLAPGSPVKQSNDDGALRPFKTRRRSANPPGPADRPGLLLGLALGFQIIASIALLISIYGAGALPYVYIAVAILGALLFYGFAELQQRYSLVQVSIVTEIIIASFFAFAWAGLRFFDASWLAFVSMVVFSLVLQVGFVIVGGQAGRLLDVRQIKRYFPRIVAGFVIGFMVAGAAAPPLLIWMGSTEQLLLAAAVCATIMAGLLLATNARYRDILALSGGRGQKLKPPPLRKVMAKRFVLLVFAYQMLSAMVSQFLDFMVMASAGERFVQSDALAHFFANYTFWLNLIDLLFLLLFAGFLLSRFGLRFGLSANGGVVVLFLLAIVAAGIVVGPEATIFFWLVVIVRIMDITFTDGTTRTSINAAYQALPAEERVTVQTGVEGIGVPMALGLTGVILLLIDALGDATLVHVAVFTLAVSLLWMVSALLVYRHYAANLLHTLRRRALDPVELTLDDKGSLAVVQRLVANGRLEDVRLALDMLQGAQHPALSDDLLLLAKTGSPEVQIEVLTRIEKLGLQVALPLVQQISRTTTRADVQGAAIRTLCALLEADAVETASPFLESLQTDVRLGAAVGLLRYGSIPGVLAVGQRLQAWELSADAADRIFLARVIGEVALPHVYQPLIALLADTDLDVRVAALNAAGQVKHPRLLPLVTANLSENHTRSAASDALVAYGDIILPAVEEALGSNTVSEEDTMRLVRICYQIKSEKVLRLMRRNLDHSSSLVRDQILLVLSACDFHAQAADFPALNKALLRDVTHGHQIMVAQQDIGATEPAAPLQRALRDELNLVNRRVFWLLSFLYEADGILRAEAQLRKGSSSEQALALEMLDVTFSSEHRTLVFPLINPKLDHSQRIQLLAKRINTQPLGRDNQLRNLIQTSNDAWTRACALYAVVKLGIVAQLSVDQMTPVIEHALADPDPVVRETAAWGLYTLAPKRFMHYAGGLLADADSHVSCLTAKLVGT